MRQGHHHGPHLGHRPWPRRGVGAVLRGVAVSANVGACLARSSGRARRLVRSIARTEDRQRLAACLFSCRAPRSGTGRVRQSARGVISTTYDFIIYCLVECW